MAHVAHVVAAGPHHTAGEWVVLEPQPLPSEAEIWAWWLEQQLPQRLGPSGDVKYYVVVKGPLEV